jgi:hypothetical protein
MGCPGSTGSGIHQHVSLTRGAWPCGHLHYFCCGLEGDHRHVCFSISCSHDPAVDSSCHDAKGEQSATMYYNKMIGFTDEMAAAGKPLEDEDFISYVLTGLDQNYNSFVDNVTGKTEISLSSLFSQFLAAEARLELQSTLQYQSSANTVARGRGSFHGRGGQQGDGGCGVFGHGFGGRSEARSSSESRPVCQLCKKVGHTILQC